MNLVEGYEWNGQWIPEITDDPRMNMELVVRSLASADALGMEDEYIGHVHGTGDPVALAEDLAHECRLALDLGLILGPLHDRLMDLLDGVS